MCTSNFYSSLRYEFFVPFFFYALCSVPYFHSMCYASFVCFSSFTQHASTHINQTQQKQPSLLCFVNIYHAKSVPDHAPNSLFSLAFILRLFFISGHYPEMFWLFWKLQYLTLFHLSIISMMSLHSTRIYLENMHLLWRSLYISLSSLSNTMTSF
jgi:hypothetical protein